MANINMTGANNTSTIIKAQKTSGHVYDGQLWPVNKVFADGHPSTDITSGKLLASMSTELMATGFIETRQIWKMEGTRQTAFIQNRV